MGAKTSIEWTRGDDGTPGATWNPLVGCTKVSPGCDHCYAENLVNRFAGHNSAFPNRFDVVTLRGDRMLKQPLRWRAPRRIFVNSLSDLFHDDVPSQFIVDVFAVMAATPRHTYQLLTKRHARMRSLLTNPGFPAAVLRSAIANDMIRDGITYHDGPEGAQVQWPLPNVWLGVSTENQQWADIRIPALLNTPAAVRWISAEPLLGPITLFGPHAGSPGPGDRIIGTTTRTDYGTGVEYDAHLEPGIDWVVVGGESGAGARPMHPSWAVSLRDQCATAGVPFLFKQWGNWAPHCPVHPDDEEHQLLFDLVGERHLIALERDGSRPQGVTDGHHWCHRQPDGTAWWMRRTTKTAAGRQLAGRTHDDYPADTHA